LWLEKVAASERLSGEGGRPATTLGRGGDAGRRSRGAMEREAWWRARSSRRHGKMQSRCYGEVRFFRTVVGHVDEQIRGGCWAVIAA
jgi:hypothetical protein